MKNNIVVKKNDFLKFGYTLSLMEQRLLLACICQVDSRATLEKDEAFEITVQEIKDLFAPDSTKHLYRDLREACDRLFERRIVIKSDFKTTKLRWVWKVEYLDNEAIIRLSFSPDVIPYKVDDVKDFKCIYSLRLYELFAQYQSLGSRELEVEELRRLFDLGDKYKVFAELKRSVIDKAINEINQYSNLTVTYGERRRSRKVVSLQFAFETKQKPITKENKSLTIDEYVRLNPVKTKGKNASEVMKLMNG
jgi:plasmid replication initiation protein